MLHIDIIKLMHVNMHISCIAIILSNINKLHANKNDLLVNINDLHIRCHTPYFFFNSITKMLFLTSPFTVVSLWLLCSLISTDKMM